MKGKFIVIDGGDGSGKALQTKLLVERLRKEGKMVEVADFPQYGKASAYFVEKYLRGEYGTIQEVGAKRASLFFALDRFEQSFELRKWLEEGAMVISNSYVSANKGHQLGNFHDVQEMNAFLSWINELEYGIFNLPVPQLTLYLHMAPEIGQQLVDTKRERAYTQGKKRDIHEEDLEHLKNAERAFLFCLEHDEVERWQRIVCFQDDMPKTIEEIHEEIYQKIKPLL